MNSIEEREIIAPVLESESLGGDIHNQPAPETEQAVESLTGKNELEITSAGPSHVTVELDENGPVSLMEQLLNDPASQIRNFQYGQVVEGIVMFKDRDEFLVDVGAKSEGVVPNRELQTLSPEQLQEIRVGDNILVFVVQPENQEGHIVLSVDKARMEKSWRRLQQQFEAGEIVEAEVYGLNKGGLLVSIDGVRGFVPSSQVSGLGGSSDNDKQAEMNRLINSRLPLKIIEINRSRNRLILSERQAAQEQRDAQKDRLMNELEVGQVRDGVITTITDFGAFVDIGGADGLVHLSEISWNRVTHPKEVLKPGERVKVYVLNIDESRKKVALSIKRTQPEPWSQIAATYQPGQILKGIITQVTTFGAFARIADGVEGLIHVSELAENRVQTPASVVNVGDEVTVRLISIDPQRKRMGLSIKRAAPDYNSDFAENKESVGAEA
ncbi:MAG TPA: 30S ribosomal protein S1 [Chloroflexia bacterium]|nr:30S ribosomal protein S1 [Chloroflexia bacterium]